MPDMPLRDPRKLFAPPALAFERRPDGSRVMRSSLALGSFPRCIGERLVHWSAEQPDRDFLLERGAGGQWQGVTYREAVQRVERLAAGVLRLGLSPERPLVILSENSVDHGLLMLAAMHVGVPSVSVSAAYSLVSADHGKLKRIVQLVNPGLVFAADSIRYGRALQAAREVSDAVLVTTDRNILPGRALRLSDLEASPDPVAVNDAYLAIGPDTVAKLLFTSGSTDEPKGVINTQRMLCSNQQARAQLWRFLSDTPPVLVDWLPWSHTFGGNFNFNSVVWHGGTLYIDDGRPAPGLFGHTVRNLTQIAPTIYLNVPRGYDMLVGALRKDAALRTSFFSRLQVIYYAASALPQNLWEALRDLAIQAVGEPVPLLSGWGSTETSPLATDCHYQAERSGVIGLPIPGTEIKLVPNGGKLEARVRGPNVTPGYWKRPDLTASHFDEEGFYKIGDAVRLFDASAPERGVCFDGRVAEDFKLDSGTWVNVGMLRVKAIAALEPVAQDIVLTGHDMPAIGFLIFPNLAACRTLCPDLPPDAPPKKVLRHVQVRTRVAAGLASLRAEGGGSSTFATRALLLAEPPDLDASEITDKGYINQRAVLRRRAALVQVLQATSEHPDVISIASSVSL
jgi:feruloyl-CoA synthase